MFSFSDTKSSGRIVAEHQIIRLQLQGTGADREH